MLVIIILAFKEVRKTRICILFKNLVLCSPCEWKIEKNKAGRRPKNTVTTTRAGRTRISESMRTPRRHGLSVLSPAAAG